MQLTPIIIYELKDRRIAVYKSEDGDFVCSNTWTGKALLCLSMEQALDTFDACLCSMFPGNKLLN